MQNDGHVGGEDDLDTHSSISSSRSASRSSHISSQLSISSHSSSSHSPSVSGMIWPRKLALHPKHVIILLKNILHVDKEDEPDEEARGHKRKRKELKNQPDSKAGHGIKSAKIEENSGKGKKYGQSTFKLVNHYSCTMIVH